MQGLGYTPFSDFVQCYEKEAHRMRRIREELHRLPVGSLYIKSVDGVPYFEQCHHGVRTGISRNRTLIYQLARRKYLQLLLHEYDQLLHKRGRKRTIILPAGQKQIASPASLYLDKCRSAGLEPLRITLSEKQYQWMHEDYEQNPMERTVTYQTYSGMEMRSKSERDIGNELELCGAPYRSEPKLVLDVSWMSGVTGNVYDGYKVYYPDFTILTADGRLIIWEHLGRLDLPEYRMRNAEKLAALRQGGFCSDTHLILTVEKDLETAEHLRQLIARRVLPLL